MNNFPLFRIQRCREAHEHTCEEEERNWRKMHFFPNSFPFDVFSIHRASCPHGTLCEWKIGEEEGIITEMSTLFFLLLPRMDDYL